MDEMMTLVNGIGTSTAEVSNTLSEIGDMFDGINDIYINALEFGEAIGYKRRLIEEPLKALENRLKGKGVFFPNACANFKNFYTECFAAKLCFGR